VNGSEDAVPNTLHLLHLLIRDRKATRDRTAPSVPFLFYVPHGLDKLTFPTKELVVGDVFPGRALDDAVDELCRELRLPEDSYAILAEVPALNQMSEGGMSTHLYAVDLWVDPAQRYLLADPDLPAASRLPGGRWLNVSDAFLLGDAVHSHARDVLNSLAADSAKLQADSRPRSPAIFPPHPPLPARSLLTLEPELTMHALTRRWAARNAGSGRILRKQDLDRIFSGRDTAPLYLRIEDPFERYQRQGVGFTWSFFTEHDLQDRHVHGAPAVEIYGVLSGKLEIWWKNYQDRGVSAWRKVILGEGDWFELAGLQCHIVHFVEGKGRGVVFRAGLGPLGGIGEIGVRGKTVCGEDCGCSLPERVKELTEMGKALPRPG